MLRLHQYRYHRPDSLDAALELLRQPDALPIAGGTDLMPNMKHRLFTPNHLVGLKGIAELRGIREEGAGPGAALVLGAAETLTTVSRDERVLRHFPALADAAGHVAAPQIRNQGTIGGNLCLDTRCTYYNQSEFWRNALGYCLKKDGEVCHVTRTGKKCVAAHSADTVPVLIALGATVELASAEGRRSVPVADFFVADGKWNTVRQPGELVVAIRVPIPEGGVRTAYRKLRQRNAVDFPLLSVAAAARLAADGSVDALTVVVTALGARPRTVTGIDKVAAGRPLADAIEPVAALALKQCHPLENIIVDPEWRHAMVPVYVRRALEGLGG